VPSGVVEVPVLIKAFDQNMEYATTAVAGSIGMEILEDDEEKGTTVQPRSGWWMVEETRKPIDKR
jgi:hypothetical protein